jgi:hypothetical protein
MQKHYVCVDRVLDESMHAALKAVPEVIRSAGSLQKLEGLFEGLFG